MRSIFKWSPVGVYFLFSAMQAMAQFSVTLPYQQVTVENVNGKAAFNGAMINGDVAKPAMPRYLVSFLLPPDVDFKDVTVSIVNPIDREIAGTWSVDPIKPPYDKNDNPMWPKGVTLIDGKDMKIYNKNAYFPAGYQGNVAFGKMRQYKIVDITVNPFQWNPVTGKLHTLTAATLVVTVPNSVLSTSASVRNIPRCAWAERLIEGKVVNFSEVQYYGATPAQSSPSQLKPAQMRMAAAAGGYGSGYAIITTNKIINSSTMLSQYENTLSNEGYNLFVLTENDYGSGGTADACAGLIRQWLFNNYSANNIQYVLLIGNPDPTNTVMPDVPMKMEPYDNPTDYFYTDLSDANDISDNIGDVMVGRIPVYPNDNGNLDTILSKTIAYKTSPDIEWRQFAMLPIAPVGVAEGDTFGAGFVTNTLIPSGWQYRRLYEPYDKESFSLIPGIVNMNPLPEVPFCNKTQVINNWTAFNPGLVCWLSHGHQEEADSILSSSTVQNLNDQYPAIVVANSCFTMLPEDPYNVGYYTLLFNAAAYIGGTRPLATYDAIDQGPQIAINLVNSLMPVGEALNSMRSQWPVQIPTGSSDVENVLLYNIYGCPEVSIGISHYGMPLPQNVTVQAVSNNQINLSWTGVSGANFYVIERGDANATRMSGFEGIGSAPGYATSFQDVGLSIGTKYKYRIYATGYGPRSGYTPIDSATTWDANNQSLLPGIPQRLTGQPYCNSVDLYWVAPSSGTAPKSYNIKRSDSASGPFVTVACTTAASTYYRCPNLLNGTPYYFQITAVNSYGQSVSSTTLSVTPAVQPINAAPSNLHMDPNFIEPSMLIPTWTDNSNDELWFKLQYSFNRTIAGDLIPVSGIVQIARDQTQVKIYDFENSTKVSFSLKAGNDSDSTAYSACTGTGTTTASTPQGGPPAVPTSFTAKAPDPITIILNWTPSTSGPKPYSFQIWSKIIPSTGSAPLFSVCAEVPGTSTRDTVPVSINNPVTQGTKMAFTIRALYYQNAWTCLRSPCSKIDTITTPGYACKAPGNLAFQVLKGPAVLLTWADSSGGQKPAFCIERSINYGNYVQIAQTGSGTGFTTTYQDNSVKTDSIYSYRIRAFLSGKPYPYSPYSNELYGIQIAAPSPPSLYYPQSSSSQIFLMWGNNYNNANGYTLQRKNGSSWTTIATPAGNVTHFIDAGLSPNTVYHYQIQASNGLGTSAWDTISGTTLPLPNAPSVLNAKAVSSSQINLTWNDNSNDESGFYIEKATSSSGPFTLIDSVFTDAKKDSSTHLSAGTTYWYRVRAFRTTFFYDFSNRTTVATVDDYSSYSNTASTATQGGGAPTAPSGLTATAVSRSQINLAWNDNSSNESGFYIERAPSGSSTFTQIGSVGANVKTYSNTGLAAGTTYQYRVRAYNGSGNSGYSNTASTATYSSTSIAQGKTASASTVQSGNAAANGNDGNTGTRWCASSATMSQWWKVDLGASKTVGEVEIMFEKTGTSGDCNDFTVETSPDNSAWTNRVDKSTNTNTAQTQAYSFSAPAAARYVRITIKDAPGTAWASLFEFRVYGK
jgi:hypothetical protein